MPKMPIPMTEEVPPALVYANGLKYDEFTGLFVLNDPVDVVPSDSSTTFQ